MFHRELARAWEKWLEWMEERRVAEVKLELCRAEEHFMTPWKARV